MAFSFYRSVTIDHTKCGASDSSNFPVLVKLSDTTLKTVSNGGHVQNSSGFDIRFYSDSALTIALTYQLQSYSASGGTVTAWVKIGTVSHSADTVFYMAYGDATISTDGSSNTTWDSNYLGVWHLEDNAATTTIVDSTSNSNNATNIANTSGKTGSGQINNALSYNGTTDASSVALNLSSVPVITIQAWVNWTTNANDDHLLGEFTTNYNTSSIAGFIIDWDNSGVSGTFEFGSGSGTNQYWSDRFPRPSAATWHLIHLVMDHSTPVNKGYVDGSSQSLTTNTHTLSAGSNFGNSTWYWMSRATSSLFAAGSLDEVRISKIERGADWVTTEWNNQNSPGNIGAASFYTVGSETSVGSGSTGNLSVTLATETVSSAGAIAIQGASSNTLALVTLSSGAVIAIQGNLSNTLGVVTISSAAVAAIQGAFTQTLGTLSLVSTGAIAIQGNLAQTLGALILSATAGGAGRTGDLAAILSSIVMSATTTKYNMYEEIAVGPIPLSKVDDYAGFPKNDSIGVRIVGPEESIDGRNSHRQLVKVTNPNPPKVTR